MKNLLLCLIAIIAVTACTAEKEVEQESSMLLKTRSITSLEVDAQFLKLKDDTASFVAGELEIEAPGNEVAVKWNVLPGYNIDTTVVSLPVENGKAHLDIKWNSCLKNQQHGPDGMTFSGGVIVTTADEAKYVRLLWAEEIDSLYYTQNPIIMETPSSAYPEPRGITLIEPMTLNMNEVLGGSIWVEFTGDRLVLDLNSLTSDLNIDLTKVNHNEPGSTVLKESGFLDFKWKDGKAPNFSFTRTIVLDVGGTKFFATIAYSKPIIGAVYRFISALPDIPGFISAKNGYVTVTVETNKAWSLSCPYSDDVIKDTDASGLKPRIEIIHINDNPSANQRLVPIIIYSQGVAKDTINIYQKGATDVNQLEYDHDNMPPVIPQPGNEYTFTFKGQNTETLQIRALVNGVPDSEGTAVVGLEAKVTVSQNPNTTSRNITFEYRVGNGAWTPLPVSTNREQLGSNGGEVDVLTYVNSNLPAGNIPQPGNTYTFNFKGTYKGRLRVRASVNGTWYTGDMSSTLSASVNIPANNTSNVLPVKFQYRAFDAVPSQWIYLPDDTKRNQDALTNAGTLTPGNLTPADEIIEWGEPASCTFTGTYAGYVYMQAVVDGVVLAGPVRGKVGEKLTLDMPQLKGDDRTIAFQYKKEGDENWQTFTQRVQKNEILSFTPISPSGDIPVEGGTYTVTLVGTYSRTVTIRAREGSSSGPIVVEETSKLDKVNANGERFHEFKLVIPRNTTGSPRAIGFSYKREDLANERGMLIKQQNYK